MCQIVLECERLLKNNIKTKNRRTIVWMLTQHSASLWFLASEEFPDPFTTQTSFNEFYFSRVSRVLGEEVNI